MPGVDIYPELAPVPGEHVIKKHRYSGRQNGIHVSPTFMIDGLD